MFCVSNAGDFHHLMISTANIVYMLQFYTKNATSFTTNIDTDSNFVSQRSLCILLRTVYIMTNASSMSLPHDCVHICSFLHSLNYTIFYAKLISWSHKYVSMLEVIVLLIHPNFACSVIAKVLINLSYCLAFDKD